MGHLFYSAKELVQYITSSFDRFTYPIPVFLELESAKLSNQEILIILSRKELGNDRRERRNRLCEGEKVRGKKTR